MNKKLFLAIIIAGVLLAFQYKVAMPIIYDIVASDLFLEDTGNERNDISDTNILTMAAFDQCNNHIANELLPDTTLVFPDNFINAFSLGAFQFVLNADLEVQSNNAPIVVKRYVCKIKYREGLDQSHLKNSDSWSIVGLTGLEDL